MKRTYTKVKGEFRIVGDFNPEEATELLGLAPTRSIKKGDDYNERIPQRPFSDWCYCTKAHYTFFSDDVLRELYETFHPKMNELLLFKKENDLEYQFNVIVKIRKNQMPGFSVEGDIVQFAAKLDSCFDFDCYWA